MPTRPDHAPQVLQGDARILGPLYDAPNDFWIYQMDLGASLSSGAEREVRVVQKLDFSPVDYPPRLQRTILDPTDHLVLALRVPAAQWPITAEGVELLSGHRPKEMPVEVDDRRREVRLEVDGPRFGSVYRLRWLPVESELPLDSTDRAVLAHGDPVQG